jgi:hypothetical protein
LTQERAYPGAEDGGPFGVVGEDDLDPMVGFEQ